MKFQNSPASKQEKTETPEQAKRNKTINIIVNVVLVVAILFAVICAFTAFMTKDGQAGPSLFGLRLLTIQSGSMEPEFYKGDLILSVGCDVQNLQEGDVITFKTVIQGQPTLNTHRIVERIEKEYAFGEVSITYRTKGDNNNIPDEYTVAPQNVIGQWKGFKLPGLGNFINFLQSSTGFLLVIVLPVALFFIWQLIQFFRSLFAYQAEKVRVQYQQQMDAQQQMNAQQQNQNPGGDKPDGQ